MCTRYDSILHETLPSEITTIIRQPQESTTQYVQDCYSPIRHDTITKDMSLFQSQPHTIHSISGTTLIKDNRRHSEQSSRKPRPISEPLLAREPKFTSDRAEGLRKSNEIALSRPTTWKTPSNPSFSAIQYSFSAFIPSSSLSTSPSSTSFSDIPPLENAYSSPLSFPSLFPQINTCHIISPNMSIAAISHACPCSSTGKHSKSSPQYPQSPSVLANSLQTMRYASEQGILLAQKSRTSLNKLLDSVMDNAAALAESKHQPQLNSISTTTAATITRNCSSAKFYIDDDDSSEEEEEESEEGDEQSFLSTPGSIKAHQKDYYRERSEQDIFHEKDQFIKASSPGGLNTSAPHPIQSSGYLELGRRQSLLSNMLIAEKHLAAQRASSSKHLNSSAIGKPRQSSFPSISYPCHNSNLQGGDSIGFTVNSQLEAQSSLKISIGGARPHEEIIVPNQINNFEKIPISPPLRRTKTSLFKNLDGLISNPSNENRQEVSSRQSQGQQPTVVSKIAPIMATASEPNDCKTVHVILDKPNTHSQIISHRKKYTPHSTLPAPTKTCRCSPATATTKTAFATVSATSKCTATTTSSAASIAAAIAATACIGEDNTLGWAQMNHIQTQIQSVYGHITSSIQKAISTASSSLQM